MTQWITQSRGRHFLVLGRMSQLENFLFDSLEFDDDYFDRNVDDAALSEREGVHCPCVCDIQSNYSTWKIHLHATQHTKKTNFDSKMSSARCLTSSVCVRISNGELCKFGTIGHVSSAHTLQLIKIRLCRCRFAGILLVTIKVRWHVGRFAKPEKFQIPES